MRILSEIDFLFQLIKINFKSSLSLRAAFFLRSIFMTINNLIFFVSWYIFFEKFKVVNGWTIYHVSLMYGLVEISLGIGATCFHGLKSMASLIEKSELDTLLVTPRSVLMGIASSRIDHSGIGNILSGAVLIILSGFTSLSDLSLIFMFIITSVIIFSSINIIFGSLAFWFKDINRLSLDLFDIVVMLSTNPSCVYQGSLKFLIFTIIPVGLVSNLPIEFFIKGNYYYILAVLGGSILLLNLAFFIFRLGIKRYESGNCMMPAF